MNSSTGSSTKISILLGVLTVIILLLTVGDIGLTWDEPLYISASESYTSWIGRIFAGPHGVLNSEVIRRAWEPNHEHPPLDKTLSGLVGIAAQNFMDALSAYRMGNILLAGVLAALLYKLLADELGHWTGLASVVALLTMPRFFFHAHLAALDVPAATMIVLVTYVFWRTKESARFRYTFLLGVVWAFAVLTKMTTLFILPTLLLWVLLMRRKAYLVFRLLLAFLIAIPLIWLLWPWLYYDTSTRVAEFLQFPLIRHWSNYQYYLGQVYPSTPWHFPFVMVWAVVPVATMALFFIGSIRLLLQRRLQALGVLMLLIAAVPIAILATGKLLTFDNDRFLIPSMPFLAALAGFGFGWLMHGLHLLLRRFQIPALAHVLTGILGLLLIASPINNMILLYPHLLSYYSEGVGGIPGAYSLGLESTYWCETYKDALGYINQNAAPGDTIWVESNSYIVLEYYQLHGLLRDDVRLILPTGDSSLFGLDTIVFAKQGYTQADFVIFQYRQTQFHDDNYHSLDLKEWLKDRTPVYRLERMGVALMDIYTNPNP
jgi:4-amino-4-deoxy-L-arabinose transferase-like glycosyltransferase